MKAGFIGIGNGAHPWRATFSPNLLKASRRITVYNRTCDKAAILEATGVR
jgi:3-hydroxyisobutyrate dehydrogenase-like beta-hydroxyacid dehydrogenase